MLRVRLAAILIPWAVSMAQQSASPNPGTSAANNSGTGTGGSRGTMPPGPFSQDSANPGFLSGRVLVSDGTAPSEGVAVQRVCGVNVTAETHTDSQGRFNLQLTGNRGLVNDVSSGAVSRGDRSDSGGGGCELRAVLPGYWSDAVALSNRHTLEDPNVGTIILHSLAKRGDFAMSATTGLAPKEARKFYEKGLQALRHNNADGAQKEFSLAVDSYARFAAAWFELGRIYEQRSHPVEARYAYSQAIAADASYASPYERLYLLDGKEALWQPAADASEKILRLDPLGFPQAYYFNAVANYELHKLDAAEKSAREAARLQGAQAEPRANYILGLILAAQGNAAASVKSLRAFLMTAPEGPAQEHARRILAGMEARTLPESITDAQK
jgi:tetratricopeptide (TPR) repeat protein